jgi:CO/xanthine dehydrogenase Mo-binding subunit
MPGVVANAIFDATGARLYDLPMTRERVLAAIKKV